MDDDSSSTARPAGARRPNRKSSPPGEAQVGPALRQAYDAMVREDIPPEMLDLLNKLG